MNLFVRFFFTILHSFFRRRLHPLSESVLHLKVWPIDLDLNLHMNNGRFLSVMDLGRVDLLLRTGLGLEVLKHRWQPLVGGGCIRYKYSLSIFRSYRLRTRVIGWDEKWLFIEQRFEYRRRTVAVGLVKAMFRGAEGNISPMHVMKVAQVNIDPPHISDKIRLSMELDELL